MLHINYVRSQPSKVSHVCQAVNVLVRLELEEAATLGDGHVDGQEGHHPSLLLLLLGVTWGSRGQDEVMDRRREGQKDGFCDSKHNAIGTCTNISVTTHCNSTRTQHSQHSHTCMYVYMHIHICTHKCICMCIYVYVCVNIYIYIYIIIYIY